LILSPLAQVPCPLPSLEGEYPIETPGSDERSATTLVSGWRVTVSHAAPDPGTETTPKPEPDQATVNPMAWTGQPWSFVLASDSLAGGLILRSRRPGDRFQPLGMDHGKKIQDFFTDSHIPRSWRDRVPVLVTKAGIAAVAGHRSAQWAIGTRNRSNPNHEVMVTIELIL